MQNTVIRLLIVAACTYTAAFLVTLLLHESAHALMALAVGTHPVLHNSYVNNPPVTPGRQVLIALAGPVFSLGQGVGCLRWVARGRGSGVGALFGLFLGVFGVINFMGYLMTGPLVAYGDIGQAEHLLGVPLAGAIAAALAAAVGLHRAMQRTAPLFMRFVPAAPAGEETGPTPELAHKRSYLRALLVWPWLVGSVLLTVLSWPWPTVLSLLYPPLSSMVLGATFGAALRRPELRGALVAPTLLRAALWRPAVALVAVAIGYRLLSAGVRL